LKHVWLAATLNRDTATGNQKFNERSRNRERGAVPVVQRLRTRRRVR